MDSSGSSQSLLRPPPESFRFCNDEPEIGRGAYGRVLPGQLAGRPVAVKRIHLLLREAERGEYAVRSFEEECRRMEKLNHPHLVKFLGAYRDTDGPFLVMERMAQDLRHFLAENKGTLSLQKQLQLCLDIATCLKYLHTQTNPLVHRDLNDKNILLDREGSASIADLGQSKLKNSPYEYFNTPAPGAMVFMPPEALSQNPHYNEKVDIFSFGVLMLEIATQQQPQPGMEGIGTVPERERRKVDLDHVLEGHPLKPLILGCLENDPHDRPCIMELCKQLAKFNFTSAKKYLVDCMNIFLEHLNPIRAFLDQIQGCPATALTTANRVRASLKRLVEATEQDQMKVVFLGSTSNGKSTVLNALLRDKVLFVGKGSTTKCFCTITGVPPDQLRDDHADGYVKTRDSQEMKLTEVPNLMKQGSLRPGDVLEIFLPAQDSNVWLNQDVVLIDSPGISAEAEVDEEIKKTCGDADVFVYVCNGTSTLEEPVKRLLEHVNCHLPNLSQNLFILFNHWDQVAGGDEESDSDDDDDTKEYPERVKEQHLERVRRFVEEGLKAKAVVDRTFFVSGKEACKAQKNEKKGKQSTAAEGGALKKNWRERWAEFRNFEAMLHEFLSGSAIQTKCGRHFESCTGYVQQLITMLEEFKRWCRGDLDKRNKDAKSKLDLLGQIEAAERTLQQTSREKVDSALAEFDTVFNEFHENIKKELRGKALVYREREGKEKWSDYQKSMIEHLDEAMKELMQPFEHQMSTFAIQQLKPLQEEYTRLTISTEELQAQAGQGSLSLEPPNCTAMTKDYCARPWLAREVLDYSMAKMRTIVKASYRNGKEEDSTENSKEELALPERRSRRHAFYETEVIEVNGEKHRVRKRDECTDLERKVTDLGFCWVLRNVLPPALSTGEGLAVDQVKGKIIEHLKYQLDANKQAIKGQYVDRLQLLLEAQINYFSKAITDRKKVLKGEVEDLQQEIAHHTLLTRATEFQDQLQQEVQAALDCFHYKFLQAESA